MALSGTVAPNDVAQASQVALVLKGLSDNVYQTQETQVRSLGRKDSQEEEMVTHSNIRGHGIPWTEEPGGLQSMGSQRVGHD